VTVGKNEKERHRLGLRWYTRFRRLTLYDPTTGLDIAGVKGVTIEDFDHCRRDVIVRFDMQGLVNSGDPLADISDELIG